MRPVAHREAYVGHGELEEAGGFGVRALQLIGERAMEVTVVVGPCRKVVSGGGHAAAYRVDLYIDKLCSRTEAF
jgi:hypothetical protein